MAEYIEREAFLEKMKRTDRYFSVKFDVEEFPAADVAPVKHGRWVMTLYTTSSKRGRVVSNKKFACSECGYGNGRKQTNYCPNCGAKMDLEVEND